MNKLLCENERVFMCNIALGDKTSIFNKFGFIPARSTLKYIKLKKIDDKVVDLYTNSNHSIFYFTFRKKSYLANLEYSHSYTISDEKNDTSDDNGGGDGDNDGNDIVLKFTNHKFNLRIYLRNIVTWKLSKH